MALVLKLLAHPQRLRIIEILHRRSAAPVHDIIAELMAPQSVVSQHLNQMKRVGLVTASRRGKEVWYSIADQRSISILNCIQGKGGSA
ncbi:MAG: metalloregulator ArsR/SmtB family transcription factor [Lentisphaerota bacterium]